MLLEEIDERGGFVFSRGMGDQSYSQMVDRNQQTIEGNMAQREDRLSRQHKGKCKINISEQLRGESKKRWILLFGSEEEEDREEI